MGTKFRDSELSEYMIHNIAMGEGGYNYYLYIHPRGLSIIMRENIAETEYRYAKAGIADNQWANRATLDYITYDQLDKE